MLENVRIMKLSSTPFEVVDFVYKQLVFIRPLAVLFVRYQVL